MKKLNESAWGEMRHRSSGKVIRKEDDVNHLDFYVFAEYIKDNYSESGDWFAIRESEDGKSRHIEIDIISGVDLSFNVVDGEIYNILVQSSNKYVDVPGLRKVFNVNVLGSSTYSVLEKDWTKSNNTFVKLIEFFLDKKTNESVWGDMRKKSSGETIRQEDDIISYDGQQMVEYIINNYRINDNSSQPRYYNVDDTLDVPVLIWKDLKEPKIYHKNVVFYDYDNNVIYVAESIYEDTLNKIKSNPDFSTFKYEGDYLAITPKTGVVNNKFLIKVIDFIIGNVDDKAIPVLDKRYVNESIWGDMRKKSSGEQTRKEDNVNILDIDGLYDYIKSKYEKRVFYLDKDTFGISNKRNIVVDVSDNVSLYTKYDKNGKIDNILLSWTKVKISMPFFDKLKERFNVQMPNVNRRTITEKDGTCTNQTYVDVIDFFLDNIDNMFVNESVWGDMRKRSSGEQTRKEDEMTQADFDALDDCIFEFATRVVWDNWKYSRESFCKCIYDYTRYSTTGEKANVGNILKYVNSHWSELNTELDDAIEREQNEKDEGMNESVWGDMRKKSSGETIRKEDEIPQELQKPLAIYIEMFASNAFKGDYTVGSYPDFRAFVKDFMNSPRIESLDFDMGDLLDYITQDHYYDVIHPVIIDTIQKINKEIDVTVDNIIDSLKNKNMNELVWGDMRKKSAGETIRKEDILNDDEKVQLNQYISDYGHEVVLSWGRGGDACNLDEFCDYIKTERKINVKIVNYVKVNWFDEICDLVSDAIERVQEEYEEDMEEMEMNESIWGNMRKKSSGSEMRKEDEVLTDMEINSLNEFTLMYCRKERAHYIQNHIVPPPPSRRKENDYEGLIKYIEDRRDENMFTNVGDYNKIIRYIKKNWDALDMDTYIKKWICSPSVMNGKKIVECDGVPGGLTPANVGGMGAAYFPGPNGEPGSGDLPSPTGIVYHQVAPFTTFLKQIKKKTKKIKKFRKEDEPCVHSPNAKVYDYVDDFREYVDRTYNQMDRR